MVGGGGWYFSGVIHSQALEVRSDFEISRELVITPEPGRRVRARGPEWALFTLAEGSTYGLSWEGGYGQVVGPAEVDGDAVVRRLAMLEGDRPTRPRAAALLRTAFPDDPESALDAPVREVLVRSGENRFPAWFAPRRGASTWAILVHGQGGSRTEMLRMMRTTRAALLPSLAITYRNDEGLARDPSNRYQLGLTEWEELDAAVKFAQRRGAEQVVLVGASMGGAIVASYLREVPDAPVAGVVLDSPMLDFGEAVSFGASQRTMPVIGQVPGPVTWAAKRFSSWRHDTDWERLDYLEDSSWLDVPALVFHGEADSLVPVEQSERLAEQHPDAVELVSLPDAEHVESWNVDPGGYDAALRDFVLSLRDD